MYASKWPPRAYKFFPLYYKYVPHICTSCIVIIISIIDYICVCYYSLLYCFLAYFFKYWDCEYCSSSHISLWSDSHKSIGASFKEFRWCTIASQWRSYVPYGRSLWFISLLVVSLSQSGSTSPFHVYFVFGLWLVHGFCLGPSKK